MSVHPMYGLVQMMSIIKNSFGDPINLFDRNLVTFNDSTSNNTIGDSPNHQ